MKTLKILPAFIILCTISVIFSSCSTSRTAVSCPEIVIKKNDYNGHLSRRNTKKIFTQRVKNKKVHHTASVLRDKIKSNSLQLAPERNLQITKLEYLSSLTVSNDLNFHPIIKKTSAPLIQNETLIIETQTDSNEHDNIPCDTIFLKSGAIILGKVEEIGQTEVKYRRCNSLSGPIISLFKSDILRIKYTDGTSDYFNPNEPITPRQNYFQDPNAFPPKTEGLGLAGFISSLTGLFIAGIPLGLIAVIFGGISLSKINKNPRKYKGRGFAIAAIIIGLVDIVAVIILLAAIV